MAAVFLSEGVRNGHFIVNESNGTRSREAGRLASGNDLVAGAVLGQITSAVTETAGTNTGNGVIGQATLGTDAINGVYTLTLETAVANGGVFSVVAPNGAVLADLTVAVAYVGSHINLTVADGATDFIVGDTFTVNVIFGEYAEHDPAASDGSQTAVAILYGNVDATTVEKDCVVIVRDCEVNEKELTFKTAMTEVNKANALTNLKTVGIIAR